MQIGQPPLMGLAVDRVMTMDAIAAKSLHRAIHAVSQNHVVVARLREDAHSVKLVNSVLSR